MNRYASALAKIARVLGKAMVSAAKKVWAAMKAIKSRMSVAWDKPDWCQWVIGISWYRPHSDKVAWVGWIYLLPFTLRITVNK